VTVAHSAPALEINPRFGYVLAMPVLPLPRRIGRAVATFAAVAVLAACLLAVAVAARAAEPDCAATNRGLARMQSADIELLNARRERVTLRAFIADEPLEMAAGYQFICPAVVARTAILFRYAAPGAGRFHMHNVKAPLDIAFFDAGGDLFQAMQMQPYRDGAEVLYGPMRKFQYALEARRGFLREKHLTAGASKLLLDSLP